jgi:ABC-type multidrug transport system fused ATPase/permease subunit
MWTTLQDQSFLLGAVLVTLVHATKFGELNLGNPVTGRYLSLMPGAKVRDFVGPYAYHIALFAFLSVSLISYYLCCRISPDILIGAAKFFGSGDADKTIQGVPYPLYVAALFIGLTQPIIPVVSRFGDVQRDFFHDRIEVPKRLIDLAERLTSAIGTRAGVDKRHLAREARNLIGGDVLSTVQTYGDLAFYKLQLERLDLGDPGTVDKAIKESSAKELRGLIERLVFCTLVAVMRQSGPRALVKVANAIGIPSAGPRFNNLGYFLTGIAASAMLFSICILTIALVFALLAEPVARIFGKSLDQSLWPSNLDNVGIEFWTIVPPIFVCLMVAVSLLAPRETPQMRNSGPSPSFASNVDLVGFFRSGASVFGLCIGVSILIKIAQLFYEYGSTLQVSEAAPSAAKLMLPMIQSFIPVAVCLFTTWYLASCAADAPRRGLSFTSTLFAIAGTVGFLAVLYDLTFLNEFLRVRPKYGPGWEHLLFSVVANALISICAFVSVVLFFKSRTVFQKPAEMLQQMHASAAMGASPKRDVYQTQRSFRTNDRRKAAPQVAGTFAKRRGVLERCPEERREAGGHLGPHLSGEHVTS